MVGRDQLAARDRAAVLRHGYSPERTLAEWLAHPTAMDELLRVVCGTPLAQIGAERRTTVPTSSSSTDERGGD